MANFRVGQRVKIVSVGNNGVFNGADPSFLIGTETVITLALYRPVHGFQYAVSADDGGWCFYPHNLQPLQDEGRKVISWSECLWQPNHESAPA